MTVTTTTGVRPQRSRGFLGVLPYLLDLVIPLVAYYSLTAAGLTPFWALVIGGGVTAVVALVNTFRRGRLDKLGALVILEIALGITLDLTVQDARLTLARASLFILVAGAWFLGTTFTGRPVTVDVTKGFAARKGGPQGVAAFEWLADNSAPFMRIQRWLSSVWAIMFIAYALLRVVVIYNVDISQAVWLNELPGLAAVLICVAASARAGKKLGTMVFARMDEMGSGTGERPARSVSEVQR